jgi:hypothetical protein
MNEIFSNFKTKLFAWHSLQICNLLTIHLIISTFKCLLILKITHSENETYIGFHLTSHLSVLGILCAWGYKKEVLVFFPFTIVS